MLKNNFIFQTNMGKKENDFFNIQKYWKYFIEPKIFFKNIYQYKNVRRKIISVHKNQIYVKEPGSLNNYSIES